LHFRVPARVGTNRPWKGITIVRGNDHQEGDMVPIVNVPRGSILLCLLLSIFAGTASAADARPGKATFGDKLSFQSTDGLEYAPSADGQAFTIAFSSIEAKISERSDPRVASKVASLVIPVAGPAIDATFVVGAVANTNDGGRATLVLVINDKSAVMHFPPNSDAKDISLQLRYRAKGVSDLRVTIFALVDIDHDHPGAGADLTVDTLDGNMGSAKAIKGPQGPKKK
jgi:hypothetical protein